MNNKRNNLILDILIVLSILLQFVILKYNCNVHNISSAKFWTQLSVAAYAFFPIFAALSGFSYIFIRKIRLSVLVGSSLACLVYYLSYIDVIQPASSFFGDHLISHILQFKFVKVAIHDESIVWIISLSFYCGLFFILYGYFGLKQKANSSSIIPKKVLHMGFGLYLVLLPFVFFITHFCSVGAYYQYGVNELLYVNKIMDTYVEQEQKDSFVLSDLKVFKNLTDAKDYYSSKNYLTMVGINTNHNKKEFLDTINTEISNLEKGWDYIVPTPQYDNIDEFTKWVEFAYNFKFNGISKEHLTFWRYSELPAPKNIDISTSQATSYHAVFILKQAKNNEIYSFLTFDRSFKDSKANLIFNWIFVLYNFIFLFSVYFLYWVHNRRFNKIRGSHV